MKNSAANAAPKSTPNEFRFTARAGRRRLSAMRIFEPHAHMYASTTAYYEAWGGGGVVYLFLPAFGLG